MVEATVVRIMKSRRTLPHNDLIAEVTKQLANRFSAQPAFIKRRIESLIEREYVERLQSDRRVGGGPLESESGESRIRLPSYRALGN